MSRPSLHAVRGEVMMSVAREYEGADWGGGDRLRHMVQLSLEPQALLSLNIAYSKVKTMR